MPAGSLRSIFIDDVYSLYIFYISYILNFHEVDILNKSQDRGQKPMGMNPIFITNGAKSASERGVDKMEKKNNKKNALIKAVTPLQHVRFESLEPLQTITF